MVKGCFGSFEFLQQDKPMSDLVYIMYKNNNTSEYVTLEEAEELKLNNLIYIYEHNSDALTQQDIFGYDYE